MALFYLYLVFLWYYHVSGNFLRRLAYANATKVILNDKPVHVINI